jgi:1-phosphofructokinase
MGIDATAVVPLEISTSESFISSSKRDGINLEIVPVEGALRFNTTLLHEGKTTKINGAARPWSTKEAKRVGDAFLALAKRSDFAVIGGTLPPTTPSGWIGDLIAEAGTRTRVVVDSSGEVLREAVSAKPFLIKPNKDEAEELLGIQILDIYHGVEAAREMRSMGAKNVLLSLGSMGSVYVDSDLTLIAKPAELKVQNTVGAGDALLAGFIGAFDSGRQLALASATAWAEATITNQNLHLNISVQDSVVSRIINEKRIIALPDAKGSRV